MNFDELINKFAQLQSLSPEKDEKKRYRFFLDGNEVLCFLLKNQVVLEADLGTTEHRDPLSLNKLLMEKCMGFIRDQRACLSIDEEDQRYCLYQRIPLNDLTPSDLQNTIENFGGCLQYLKEQLQSIK